MTRTPSLFTHIADQLCTPLLAPLLHSRSTGIISVGAAMLHGGLTLLGLPSWQCPIRHGLGLPCPGCGLSRAIIALLQGDWQTSFTYHAFAPLCLVMLIFIITVTLLPSSARDHVIARVEDIEQRTGLALVLLLAFVLYWLARLVILRDVFINLIVS